MCHRILLICCAFAVSLSFQFVTAAQTAKTTDVTVFAAASLNEAFSAIAQEFEHANPGTKIVFNFAGSQQLVQQIAQGAPVDILASANMKQMLGAVKTGRIDSASIAIFTRNKLVVVCPKENAAGVLSLQDLVRISRARPRFLRACPSGGCTDATMRSPHATTCRTDATTRADNDLG